MSKGFVEMIFIDDGDARQTDMRRTATRRDFNSLKCFDVPAKRATFLLDYHDANGDLIDTIAVDNHGFEAITGHRPKPARAYRKIDRDYWAEARKEYAALSARQGAESK